MRDCRFADKNGICYNDNAVCDFCEYEKEQRYRCMEYEGKNA